MLHQLPRDCARGFGALISDMVLCAILICQVPIMSGMEGVWLDLGAWCLLLTALFLADRILVYRQTAVNCYIVWNVLAVTLGTWYVMAHSRGLEGWTELQWIFAGGVILTGVHSAWAAGSLPGANGILRYVDVLIAVLAFYLYEVWWAGHGGAAEGVTGGMGQDMTGLILPFAMGAIVLDLTAVNQIRTKGDDVPVIQGSGAASKVMLVLAGCGILGVTAAVVGFASGKVHSAVDLFLWVMGYVMRGIGAVMNLFVMALGNLIYFILMLLPNAPAGIQNSEMYIQKQEIVDEVESAAVHLPAWIGAALLTLLAAAGLVWILRLFRGAKMKGMRPAAAGRRIVRKSHVAEALLALAGRAWEAAVFEFRYRRRCNSLEGILVFAERAGKRRKLSRRPDEGPGEYLRRLAARTAADESRNEDRGELCLLSRRLDRYCYGDGETDLKPGEGRRLREMILRGMN